MDDFLKDSASLTMELGGTVFEISSDEVHEYDLEFDLQTTLKLQKVVRQIKKCISNYNHCHRLRNALMYNKNRIVKIGMFLEETHDMYLINNVMVDGDDRIFQERRVRRSCYCPPGFICHGCANVTTSYFKSKTVLREYYQTQFSNISLNNQNKTLQDAASNTSKNILIDFQVHKSAGGNQGSQTTQKSEEGKHFKGITIKRTFGLTTSSKKSPTTSKERIFSTLLKALSEAAMAK